MEVLLPNDEIIEGLYFLANAAKDTGVLFFSYAVFLVLSVIKAGLLTNLEFIIPGETYLAYTQPLYLLSFLTPPYPPIAQLSPYYITGFADAEGCFFVVIKKYEKSILGESVGLRFIITQHSRDEKFIINCLIKYLGCGKYYSRSNKDYGELIVEKFSDIVEIIIPFFEKFKLQGAKQKDFENLKRVALLMQSKAHLTSQGLEEIRKIKSVMNTRI